jgi:hypothetical protein
VVEWTPRHRATDEEAEALKARAERKLLQRSGNFGHPGWEGAPTLADSVAVCFPHARQELCLRTYTPLNVRVLGGFLEPCFNEDGEYCVTRASLDREVQWWSEAPLWRRVLRRLQWLRLAEP